MEKRGSRIVNVLLILEVDKMVNLSNEDRNVEVPRLAADGYVARNLPSLEVRAFDGKGSTSEIDVGDVD